MISAVRQNATLSALPLAKGRNDAPGVLQVQRVQSELLRQIDDARSTQESRLKELDTRLSDIQRDLKPRFQDLEGRQSACQTQLAQTQKKVQDIVSTEVSSLRRQLDDLLMKFDRFAKVEVQSKVRPMLEELKQSKSMLAEFTSTTTTSFKRLTDQVKALTDSVAAMATRLQTEQARFAADLDEMEPKLAQLEQQQSQLRAMMQDAGASVSSSSVAGQIDEIIVQISRLEELLPAEIAQSREGFDEAIVGVRKACQGQVQELEGTLDDLSKSNIEIEERRAQVDDSLSTATAQSYDIERDFSKLSENTKMRMKALEQGITSKLSILKLKLTDFQAEQEAQAQQFNEQVTSDVAALGQQIQRSAQELKGEVKSKTAENQQAQEEALQAIAAMKDLLDGTGNISGKITAIEGRLTDLLPEMTERIAARAEVPDAYPQNTVNRLKALEDRLLEAEQRINALDSKGVGKPAKYTPSPEDIPPEPPLASPAEAEADGPADSEAEREADPNQG
jgi:chromosome segregation ATPase